VVFPYVDVVDRILKKIDLGKRYIFNTRGDPIVSFHPEDLAKCYHMEKGTLNMDNELLNGFKHTKKYLCCIRYKTYKQFKLKPTGGYPITLQMNPYQYMVAMLCRLYREINASNFFILYIPLIHYRADEGSCFKWDNILSTNLAEAITTFTKSHPRTFLNFHMSSYPIDIMLVSQQYPKMGWAW